MMHVPVTWRAFGGASLLGALQETVAWGCDGVQVAAAMPAFAIDRLPEADLEAAAAFRAEHDLLLSIDCANSGVSLWTASSDLTQGVISYLGKLVNAAERLGAHAMALSAGAPPWALHPGDTMARVGPEERAHLLQCFEDNLMRAVGLGVGRMSVCMAIGGLTAEACERMEPLLHEGLMHLCLDLGPDRDPLAEGECAPFLRDHAERIRMVRLWEPPPEGESGRSRLRLMARLMQVDVREWCVALGRGTEEEPPVAAFRAALDMAMQMAMRGETS
jgi:hypothetical protein